MVFDEDDEDEAGSNDMVKTPRLFEFNQGLVMERHVTFWKKVSVFPTFQGGDYMHELGEDDEDDDDDEGGKMDDDRCRCGYNCKSKRIELARALAFLAADSNRDPGMTGASMPLCWKQMMRRTATFGNLAFSLEL